MTDLISLPALNQNLGRLVLLRLIVLGAIVVAVITVTGWLGLELPLVRLGAITASYAALTALVFWRLLRGWAVTELEFVLHLSSDVLLLSGLLYFSGGAANPFVSLFLLWVVIAATTLAAGYAWYVTGLTVFCYSLLMNYYVPLTSAEHLQHLDHFGLHVIGMWVNFLVSAVLVAWFVVRMAKAIQQRDQRLAQVREKALRDDKVLALGLLAAGAAHELATPISTMKVLLGEMARDAQEAALRADLRTLNDQIEVCRTIIQGLATSAGQGPGHEAHAMTLAEFLHQTIRRWQLLRPSVSVQSRFGAGVESTRVLADDTFATSLISLLNNAANASPDSIEFAVEREGNELTIEILDRGPGVDKELARAAGKAIFTNRADGSGLGIGLFLANATIERLGGNILLLNRPGGGACTRLRLPLDRLQRLPT